jgi:hypothetical protein
MPKPIAYKTGTIQPPNTAKQNNVLVGVGPSNWGAGAANATFYNSLDSSYQYVVVKNSNPPAMWGTGDFTTGSLLTTINGLPERVGQTRFTNVSTAISWSLASGQYSILRNEELFGDNGLIVSLKPKSINRISNGNFNGPSIYGGDRYPFYFDYGSPSPVVVDISNDKPYVGSNSTKAMKMFAGGGFWAGIGGELGLEVGKQYTISWWYKQNNSNNYRFVWNNQGGSGDNNFYLYTATATTTWSKSSVTFTHVVDKYYLFLISAGSDAGSELLMTEIQLEEGNTPTAFKPFNDYDYPTNRGIGTGSLTLTNMAGYQRWVWDGKYGGGYTFDGVDDRITYPIGHSTWNDKTFTIESWFEWGTSGSNGNYGWFELAGAGGSNWGLSHVPRTGAFNFCWVSSASNRGYYVLNNAIQDNVPLHMAITFNGVGGNNAATLYNNTKIYINGVLQTNIEGGGAGVSGNSVISVGGQQYPFKGNIYTFNYYDRVLSNTEIENIYDAGAPVYLPTSSIVNQGLTVYYDFSNPNCYAGSGTTIYDLSGYNNNGTLINGPTFSTDGGGALVFDGVDDYVQFTSTYAGTICFWGIADVGATDGLQALVGVTSTGDGALRFLGGTFRGNATGGEAGTADVNDYQYGYTNQFMINGVSSLPKTGQGYYVVPNGRTLTQNFYVGAIGNRNVSTLSHIFQGRVYKGKIFKVMIYNRQLTNAELLQNYNAFKAQYGL